MFISAFGELGLFCIINVVTVRNFRLGGRVLGSFGILFCDFLLVILWFMEHLLLCD